MKKKRVHIWMAGLLAVMSIFMLTGCREEESAKVSKAYYVISEELDIKKTADKVQEILETTTISDNGQVSENIADHQN